MSSTRAVSRRDSVRTLAFVGVAMASGLAASTEEKSGASAAGPEKAAGPEAAPPTGAAAVAISRFGKGHACSQAVFTAFAEQMGVDYQTAMKIASGFGGGMYSGSICGAVTGAYMALGLKYGGEPNAPMAKLVKEFNERFRAKHPSLNCAELLGVDLAKVDLSAPEQVKALKERIMKEKNPLLLCGAFVRDAAEIVDAMVTRGA